MMIINRRFLYLLSLTLLFACSTRQELFIDYSNPQIVYSGRIDFIEKTKQTPILK